MSADTNDIVMQIERSDYALLEVIDERIRAHLKHDTNGDSMERRGPTDEAWLSVLMEEVGEVARAICEHRHGHTDYPQFMAELRSELIQVAAMTTAWVASIDRAADTPRKDTP